MLKDRLKELVQLCYLKTDGQRRYKYLVFGQDKSYFVKKKPTLILPKSSLKLIYSKYLSFWLTTYLLCLVGLFSNRQSAFLWVLIVLPFSSTCSFIRTYEADFRQGLLKKYEKKPTRSSNFTFRYIDDVLSLYNCKFGNFVDRIYPIGLEIKNATDTARSALYLVLHLSIDNEGRIRTKHYDKRDDVNFLIVNFPFICCKIPTASAYGVYISQLIRYFRACGSYHDFLDRGLRLTIKLLIPIDSMIW